ncbi:MAG: cysteine desulfurase family protein [Candidatus Nitrospinota bacterium M3_3B_026]
MTAPRLVYLDNNATTPVRPEALEAMLPFYEASFGNPSSAHRLGREAKAWISDARETIASAIGAKPSEIFFTSGGTEADNLAVKGFAAANRSGASPAIVTSAIEHPAVFGSLEYLENNGIAVRKAPVSGAGAVDEKAVAEAVDDDTILVTIMLANNESGVIQPVGRIAELARTKGAAVHTDAVQAFMKIPVNVDDLGVDMLSLSSHKVNGPKGVGALYVRSGTKVEPLFHGGHHERGLRAGTENAPGIIGFAKAVELGAAELESEAERIRSLRDELERRIIETIKDVRVNGGGERRLPGTLNASFKGADGEALFINLDMEGVLVSTGSACGSGAMEPSHVLKAMDVPAEFINGSLRISLGRQNTMEDVDYLMAVLPDIVERARGASTS